MAENRENAFHELQLYAIHFRYWLSRNFTSACAVVSLSLPMMHNPYCSVFVCGVAPMPPGPSFTSLEYLWIIGKHFFIKYKYRRNISFCEKDQTLYPFHTFHLHSRHVFGPFFAAPDGNIPLKIIGKWMPFGVSFSPGRQRGRSALARGSVRQSGRSLTLLVFNFERVCK